ncbi:MAG: Hsp20/alpha crystallin family protein [Oscillospiraceae bacterium]|nr:Hsp20/alpha crystallin family protein [Oscillospiraceae bacterium]
MFVPGVFRRNVFDDFFEYPFGDRNAAQLMKTDVMESDQDYTILIDLPGIEKENVTAELKDGYLTITAASSQQNDSQDDNGRYLRRERFSGSYSRSFYVGDTVTEQDIGAKFENGVLKLTIPKKEPQPAVETKRLIQIEG